MNQKLQRNSVQTLSFLSFTKMMFSAMLILAFSFTAQRAVAQKNVVAGLLPTISIDSLANKTNSSRIYITDGVDFDSLPERVVGLIPYRWLSVVVNSLPVTVDFTFPRTTLTSADIYCGWYEYVGSTGNGGQFTDMDMQIFTGFSWDDIPSDTLRTYGGLHKNFKFKTPVTTDHIRLNIKQIQEGIGGRIRLDEIKIWDNSVSGLIPTKANATLSTFPNPVKDVLRVNLEKVSDAQTIEILNLTGKIIVSQQLAGQKTVSIDTSDLSAGLYICRTKGANGILTAKIVKQ